MSKKENALEYIVLQQERINILLDLSAEMLATLQIKMNAGELPRDFDPILQEWKGRFFMFREEAMKKAEETTSQILEGLHCGGGCGGACKCQEN